MKITLHSLCRSIRVAPIAIAFVLGAHAVADQDKNYNGPVTGYEKFNCEGDGKDFASKKLLQKTEVVYWSWHPVDDEEECTNLAMGETIVRAKRLPQVFFTTLVIPSALRAINYNEWSNRSWRNAMRTTQACWRQKAKTKGVAYVDENYKIVLDWNLGAQGLTDIDWEQEPPTFEGIRINPWVIGLQASEHGHWFYTDFVYTLIHETIHTERFFSDNYDRNSILEEREVQELAYKRYQAIYGSNIEPPFTFKEKSVLLEEMEDTGWNELFEELNSLKGSTDPDDQDRLKEVDTQLKALTQQLMQGIPNEDYDKDKHKIDAC